MTIVNIRGASGSGKSTLVRRFLDEHAHEPIYGKFHTWKKDKVIGYEVYGDKRTYVIGRYETACGGCDTLTWKGSHDTIEELVRHYALQGNVIFEGLSVSSSITRWSKIAEDAKYGKFIWAFMDTSEDECLERIIKRSGREPKRDSKGLADYNRKHAGCLRQRATLSSRAGATVVGLTSDNRGYEKLLEVLNASA